MHYLSTTQNDAAWTAAVAELERLAPTSRAAALQLAELHRNPKATFRTYALGHEVELSRPANWDANRKIMADIKKIGTPQARTALRVVASTPVALARGTVKLCKRTGMQTRHFDGKCRLDPSKCTCGGSGHGPEAA